MPKSKKLTDKQRIAQLEAELLSVTKVMMLAIERINTIVGITPDYVHTPVEPLKEK